MADPRWYAERSSLNARTDEDQAMASEKLGPFESRDEARRVLIGHFKDGVGFALASQPGSTAHIFGTEYLYLLYRVAADPDAGQWTYQGVLWSIWEMLDGVPVVDQSARETRAERCAAGDHEACLAGECDVAAAIAGLPVGTWRPTRWTPTSVADGTVTFNVADLTPRMRTALLNTRPDDRLDGRDPWGTIVALVNRGMVEAGGNGRLLPLTEAGLRARTQLEEPDEAAGAALDAELAPERKSHSWGLGRLESAVHNFLRSIDDEFSDMPRDAEIALLRRALADVRTHCGLED